MIKNHFKIAWRTIAKDNVYSIINIAGLTIGLCACMLVSTVVLDNLSYDKFWARKDDLYRIITHDSTRALAGKKALAPAGLGDALKDNFPEVEATSKIHTWHYDFRKTKTDGEPIQMKVIRADTNVWSMLDFTITAGNPQHYTNDVNNLIITDRFRQQNFPNENPIGKILYSGANATPFLITGIIADLPTNTYLRAEGLHVTKASPQALSHDGRGGYYKEELILMKPNTDIVAFTKKVNHWYRDFLTDVPDSKKGAISSYEFQPIGDIYLKSDFADQDIKGSPSDMFIFSLVAVLLLAIACINFVNLSSARAIRRLRETGIRKVVGASKSQLTSQFLVEGLLFFGISMILACSFYALFLQPLNQFIGHELTVSLIGDMPLFLSLLLLVLFIGLITSTYPATMISGFKASNALKNRFRASNLSTVSTARKILIATQFGLALLVLIGMITVWRQMRFMADKDLGFNPSNVLAIRSFNTRGSSGALKHEISQIPGVDQVSFTRWVPTLGTGDMVMKLPHPQRPAETIELNFIIGDTDLPALLGFRLLDGRLFDNRDVNTATTAFRIDEAGLMSPLKSSKVLLTANTAKQLEIPMLEESAPLMNATPVGIIDDFHSVSLRDPIKPTVIQLDGDLNYASVLIKVKAGYESRVMRNLNLLWKQFHPEQTLRLDWLEDLVKNQYEKETKLSYLFTLFSILTLFLASLGIFGLVVQATGQRVKEIGIRKVLGASVASIVRLFAIDYIKLVAIALVIASPIAWWAMTRWLEDFAYRIDVAWWIFALAGVVAGATALLTVGWQAIRAAVANPVESLRDE